jgi:amino acid adenylation domain-containing protein
MQSFRVRPANPFIVFEKEKSEQSIVARFEQEAHSYPHHLAVKTKSHQFTYNLLNQESNRLARTILAKQGRSEEPILLLLEQGPAPPVASLGVLKAGKFYVPLDPSYPLQRLIAMVEDSQAALIVTNDRNLHLATMLVQQGSQLINLDELAPHFSTENLCLSISPESLACIIYTSGSTGRPKGVVHTHRTIMHMMMTYTNALHICAMDRLSLLYSPSVIGAVRTSFLALLNGAALLPFDLKETGLTHVAPWLIREEITCYRSVPTLFRYFVKTLTGEEVFPKLRLIWLGGEPIYKSDVDLYKAHFSQDCILVCGLGSTETFTFRWSLIDKQTQIVTGTVPVCDAVGDTEVLILDEKGHEVGDNCVGEIVVKRPVLAVGYWRQPERTKEVFRLDPTGGNARLYNTGDMGRMSPDGCLEHVGRKDFQVKIRGHRIEITEIEVVLRAHPTVTEAVVNVREHRAGEPQLIAYLVPSQHSAPTISALRHFIQERLPDYMIPSVFVMLDALPLTVNGKVDRRALLELDPVGSELEGTFIAPHNPVEKKLAEIWAQVLGLDTVNVHDNFFELGGHSLLATQVLSRLRDAFQVELPLRALFEAPTIAGLARAVVQCQGAREEADELAHLLAEVEDLSEDEAQQRLADEWGSGRS